jgi:hypothetical protein
MSHELAPRRVQEGVVLKEETQRVQETHPREFTLRMEHDVLPGQDVLIYSSPAISFRPERLIIPAPIAPNFHIVDIKIGMHSQFGNHQPFPALFFSELAQGFNAFHLSNFDLCDPGCGIALHVRNITNRKSQFVALFIGPTIA